MKPTSALFLVLVMLVATTATPTLAAFIESFTTNPEVESPRFNKAAPFLWVTLGSIVSGGRGPADPASPTAGNAMQLTGSENTPTGVPNPQAETTVMNWSQNTTSVDDSRLSFYMHLRSAGTCTRENPHSGTLKLSWSHDSLTWQPLWNYTVAQMSFEQWEPVVVKIPTKVRADPVAFKWTFKHTGCDAYLYLTLDDITFPTIAPSADTINLVKAPPAPLPSPAVCSALCQAPSVAQPDASAGGRRLRMVA